MAGSTRNIVVALCGATALALAACGGGGDGDEDKIRDVVKDVDNNPASLCTDYGTDQLIQKLGGEKTCSAAAEQAAKQDPSKTTVESVDVNGDKATAKLKDDTGNSTVTFVKEDGEWKVSDSVSG
jgi:hypothetical protein